MKRFRMWHAECASEAEGDVVEAETVEDAAKTLVFVYYAGDCDKGADKVWEAKDRWTATREGSPDYFYIKEEK